MDWCGGRTLLLKQVARATGWHNSGDFLLSFPPAVIGASAARSRYNKSRDSCEIFTWHAPKFTWSTAATGRHRCSRFGVVVSKFCTKLHSRPGRKWFRVENKKRKTRAQWICVRRVFPYSRIWKRKCDRGAARDDRGATIRLECGIVRFWKRALAEKWRSSAEHRWGQCYWRHSCWFLQCWWCRRGPRMLRPWNTTWDPFRQPASGNQRVLIQVSDCNEFNYPT